MELQSAMLLKQNSGLKVMLKTALKEKSKAQDEKRKTVRDIEFMKELLATVEKSKTKAITDLNEAKKNLQVMRTENFKLKETVVISSGTQTFIKEQLQTALNVTASLGTLKTVTEEHNFKYSKLDRDFQKLLTENKAQKSEVIDLRKNNDEMLKNLHIVNKSRQKIQAEKIIQFKALKDKIAEQDIYTNDTRKRNETISTELETKTKEIKNLNEERSRLRARIQRLKQRKVVNNIDTLLSCKICNNEYSEAENFNWSCRTHQGQWGGTMYWCCGSKHQEELGCRFAKHINKDAEKEEDQSDEDESDLLKKQLCICCKKLGHKEENCPLDPNF